FWSLVIAGGLIKRRGQALRNPGQLRARPRLMLRPYDTKCPIKYQLLQLSAAGGIRRAPLNPRKPASLSEAFPPAEARRRIERFEWHFSPKHGSWLNMAESELAVLSNQCLDRRIPGQETRIKEIAAWEEDQNTNHAKADWQLTAENVRIKLKYLYPTFHVTHAAGDQFWVGFGSYGTVVRLNG
ncbi:MAG: hypothetical protein WBE80_11155, partial [Methylocella sp.]